MTLTNTGENTKTAHSKRSIEKGSVILCSNWNTLASLPKLGAHTAHTNMEDNKIFSNLSFPQGTVSNEELDPRILATSYAMYIIGEFEVFIV